MSIAFGRVAAAAAVSLTALASWPAVAAELPDGTPVPVRLVGVINSETTCAGQPLRFVVDHDVRIDGSVLIKRGAPVAGVVTESRRAHWGFTHRKPRLAFKFTVTTARDGQIVMLRASAVHGSKDDSVRVDRNRRHHEIRWAAGADTFQAYVDGSYEI